MFITKEIKKGIMKKVEFMSLDASESVGKEEVSKNSYRKHKSLSFRFLLFVLLFPVTAGSFFVACNSGDSFLENTINDMELGMLEVLEKHLTVENNRYVLKLSETDAMASGVSQSFYAEFLDEMTKLNDFIESTENDPNISVSFNDENSHNINYRTVRLKDGNEENINGWIFLQKISTSNVTDITTITINTSSGTINMPSGTTDIKFAFRSSIPSHSQVSMKYRIFETQNEIRTVRNNIEINFTITQPTTWHVAFTTASQYECWIDVYYKK
jgi:hypothetical protein